SAITSGGAIPDTADYAVVLEPSDLVIGSVNEDFAIESLQGDIFQLGNTSWRVLRVEQGKVRVEDAAGQPPSIPFWLGEAPGRTTEPSFAVSRLREEISDHLGDPDSLTAQDDIANTNAWKIESSEWLVADKGISPEVADQLVNYLG